MDLIEFNFKEKRAFLLLYRERRSWWSTFGVLTFHVMNTFLFASVQPAMAQERMWNKALLANVEALASVWEASKNMRHQIKP